MNLKTLATWLIIISALSYAGLKGYIYFKIKDPLDEVIRTAEPFAHIQYGSIGSSLDGSVQLNDIVVTPRTVHDSVRIEQLKLITPSLEFLLNGTESMRKGELPERLGLEILAVRINLYGDLAKALEEMAETNRASADDVCLLGGDNIITQYRELGLRELVVDGKVLVERPGPPSEMRIKMSSTSHGVDQTDLSIVLANIGGGIARIGTSSPLLKTMSVRYQPNPDFTRTFLEYCSKQQSTTSAAYIEQLVNKEDDYFANTLGFIPGPGIRSGIRQILETNAELRIDALPSSALDISTVHLYKPEDWPTLFGLAVSVGGTPIDDLSFRIPDDVISPENPEAESTTPAAIAQQDSAEVPSLNVKRSIVKPAHQKSRRSGYRAVGVGELSDLLYKDVRIVTAQGYRRSGRVLGVKDNTVTLEQRIKGGTMSTEVSVASIRTLEVFQGAR